MKHFSKILIANRGEIACRIIQSARSLGYQTVAVYSEADEQSRHVFLADQSTCIGHSEVSKSYLSISAMIDAAKRTQADAIHPGYGFLSENDEFARACVEAGIVFIGPSAEAIFAMGNKSAAKKLAIEAGVPTIPGYQGNEQDDETLKKEAQKIGFPILIKAVAGGGGRGMRLVEEEREWQASLQTARAEAQSAFGNDQVLLERALFDARHIEIQIFADSHGNIVHLFERDCSIQRRHQKIIEEAPSPFVDESLRKKMGEAAIAIAKKIQYVGAGTVEFLVDQNRSFYFLEMNTRLQVEHPVTELITGLDLVSLQLRIARGEKLPFEQKDIKLNGHAIEVRLYAEDPYQGFLPQTGNILLFRTGLDENSESNVVDGHRVDHGIHEGQVISSWYDPMLAKLIAHGQDREEARRKLRVLLKSNCIFGTVTNKTFLHQILDHTKFIEGKATTAFIEKYMREEGSRHPINPLVPNRLRAIAALITTMHYGNAWSSTHHVHLSVRILEKEKKHVLNIYKKEARSFQVSFADVNETVEIIKQQNNRLWWSHGGVTDTLVYLRDGLTSWFDDGFHVFKIEEITKNDAKEKEHGTGRIVAPMNGRIVDIRCCEGEQVQIGQALLVLEAMKMQHELTSDVQGTVHQLHVSKDAQVANKELLAEINIR